MRSLLRSPTSEQPPEREGHGFAGSRAQFRQLLRHLPYDEQVQALAPPPVSSLSPSLQFQDDDRRTEEEGAPDLDLPQGPPPSLLSPPDAAPSEEVEAEVEEALERFRGLIVHARAVGWDTAANHLERFLAGTGGTVEVPPAWLNEFEVVVAAVSVNVERFENQLADAACSLEEGRSRYLLDHWDRLIEADTDTELLFASGDSSLTSTGTFVLARQGNIVSIEGTVEHRWWDSYDWHAGLAVTVPGVGSVPDTDALLLQEHAGAAPFEMSAVWLQSLSATLEVVAEGVCSRSFDWSSLE